MKKRLRFKEFLLLLCLTLLPATLLQAEETNVAVPKKAEGYTLVKIYLANDNLTAAQLALENSKDKKSLEYLLLYADLQDKLGRKDIALDVYLKSEKSDKNNLKIKIKIVTLSMELNKKDDDFETRLSELLKLNLTQSDRDVIKKLQSTSIKKVEKQNNIVTYFNGFVELNDNVLRNDDKKKDVGQGLVVDSIYRKDYEDFFINYFGGVENVFYLSEKSAKTFDTYLGAEYNKGFKGYQIAIPTFISYGFMDFDSSEYIFSLAFNYDKIINKEKKYTLNPYFLGKKDFSLDTKSINSGFKYSYYKNYSKTKLKYSATIYNENSSDSNLDYNSIGSAIKMSEPINKNSSYNVKYDLEYRKYMKTSSGSSGDKRGDLLNTVTLSYINLYKDVWNYNFEYRLSINESNDKAVEYKQNRFRIGLERFF